MVKTKKTTTNAFDLSLSWQMPKKKKKKHFKCRFDIYIFFNLSPDLQCRGASELYRRLRCPQKQLDAIRQPGSLAGRTEPGGLPEQQRHLLLHHPAGGAQPGAAGVVQPWVFPEALQPAGWHQTKWVQHKDSLSALGTDLLIFIFGDDFMIKWCPVYRYFLDVPNTPAKLGLQLFNSWSCRIKPHLGQTCDFSQTRAPL